MCKIENMAIWVVFAVSMITVAHTVAPTFYIGF